MKNKIFLEKLTTAGFYIAIIIFFIAFNFQDSRNIGWYQQFLPNLNGKPISDVFFLDSLTGWGVTGTNSGSGQINYIIKTTNGGDNWNFVFNDTCFFSKVKFIDSNTGFSSGGSGGGRAYFYKSTNGGINWNRIYNTGVAEFEDMSVLNKDTIWVVDHDGLVGGVFRTTNGGISWTQQFSAGTENPNKIYMYNARIGFICNNTNNSSLKKTTNGGENWFPVLTRGSFRDMYFTDSLTGWRAFGNNMYKTTNGGINWLTQPLPSGGILITSGIYKFSNINSDTIWGAGGYVFYGSGIFRGVVYRTTNGGNNWFYQIPDTTMQIPQYYFMKFINNKNGWSYAVNNGIHTTTGGDTIFYTGIQQISSIIPKTFELMQNYPNPFNSRTIIKYKIKKAGYIKLFVYDITGKEVQRMVDMHQSAGEYDVDFMGKFAPSGVYFYRMEVTDEKTKQLFTDTKKMLMIK